MIALRQLYTRCGTAGSRCTIVKLLYPNCQEFLAIIGVQEDIEVVVGLREGSRVNRGIAGLQRDILIEYHPGRIACHVGMYGRCASIRIIQEDVLCGDRKSTRLNS